MAEENRWKPDEDDEEEELDETFYKAAKDALIFIIEVSPSMLTAPPTESKKTDTSSPTLAALKCAYSLMQQRIISNPNDMMGVLLYGTETTKFESQAQSSGTHAYPHFYLLTDLDIPAAGDVKVLKALANIEEDHKEILKPSEEPVAMANVLFCANQLFTVKAPNFSSRRVFIITDDDDPHKHDKAMKSSAAVRAKDLYDLGVTIELFPISKPGHEFDRGKFYDDIIYNASPSDPEAPVPISGVAPPSSTKDGISLLTSLLSSINSKAVAKRALFSNLPLEIGPGFTISVRGYIIFKRQEPKRSCYVSLEGDRPQIATGVTTQMADDTARTVEKVEIRKAFKFGGEQITFTPEEVDALRHFGDPGIRIIGFKPMSMLPIWANLKPSTFIYPSEDDYVGSTRVFAALQKKLLNDRKIGIAWYVARKNAVPQIAAIIPGAEKLDDLGAQVIPPGLWIAPLPFADDIRQNPETTLIRAPEPLIDLMREIIQQLQLPKAIYDPSRYPNPSLQWHYRILQAMALEEEIPEQPDDKTIPKYRQIDKRAGPYTIDWGMELEAQHAAWEKENRPTGSVSTSGKRSAADDLSVRAKKAKTPLEGDDAVIDDASMRKLFDKDDIKKLTVAELKPWLSSKGIDISGRKADLVQRVELFFEAG